MVRAIGSVTSRAPGTRDGARRSTTRAAAGSAGVACRGRPGVGLVGADERARAAPGRGGGGRDRANSSPRVDRAEHGSPTATPSAPSVPWVGEPVEERGQRGRAVWRGRRRRRPGGGVDCEVEVGQLGERPVAGEDGVGRRVRRVVGGVVGDHGPNGSSRRRSTMSNCAAKVAVAVAFDRRGQSWPDGTATACDPGRAGRATGGGAHRCGRGPPGASSGRGPQQRPGGSWCPAVYWPVQLAEPAHCRSRPPVSTGATGWRARRRGGARP